MRNFFKHFIPGFFLLATIAGCSSEPRSFEEELRQAYQHDKGFYYLKVPPALLSLALQITDDQELIDFFGDARQVGIISFGESMHSIENDELVRSLEDLLIKYEYEDLIRISDQDRLISMKVKEDMGNITELVAIVSQTEGPVMAMTLSGEINLQTIVKMAADFDYDRLMQMQGMGRR